MNDEVYNRHNEEQRDRMTVYGWEHVGTFPADYDKSTQSQDYSWVDIQYVSMDGFSLFDKVNVYRKPLAGDNDTWLTELRQGATRRLEELTTYWHGHESFANDGVFITQTPPITSEAAYHQSMIAEE